MVLVRAGGATFGAYLSDPLVPVLSVDQYSDESNFYMHTYIHAYMRIHAYTHASTISFCIYVQFFIAYNTHVC